MLSFRVEPPTDLFIYVGVSFGICYLLSNSMLDAIFFTSGAQPLGFATLQPFRAYLWQAYVNPGDSHWPMPAMH